MKILEFFQENGVLSSTRLVFITGTFYAMAMGAWVYAVSADWSASLGMITGVSAVFIGGKLIQKPMEKP